MPLARREDAEHRGYRIELSTGKEERLSSTTVCEPGEINNPRSKREREVDSRERRRPATENGGAGKCSLRDWSQPSAAGNGNYIILGDQSLSSPAVFSSR